MKNEFAQQQKRKTWLLRTCHRWHMWTGVAAALFLLSVGLTGIVLNYKRPIFGALGLEMQEQKPRGKESHDAKPAGLQLTTAGGFAALPVGIERVLELARAEWGDVPVERVEFKEERGALIYKLKRKGGQEILVNAQTGEHFAKGEYEKLVMGGAGGAPARQTDWGKILMDVHTGKIGGEAGKAVMSLAALMMTFLTGSGMYLWAKPLLMRRRLARLHTPKPADACTPVPGETQQV